MDEVARRLGGRHYITGGGGEKQHVNQNIFCCPNLDESGINLGQDQDFRGLVRRKLPSIHWGPEITDPHLEPISRIETPAAIENVGEAAGEGSCVCDVVDVVFVYAAFLREWVQSTGSFEHNDNDDSPGFSPLR